MTPRAWLAAVALVALGAVGGITVDRLHIRGRHGEMARLHQRLREDPMAVIDRELELTAEQRTRISAILARRQESINGVWHELHPRIRSTIDSTMSEIAALLDSAQTARFRGLMERIHRRPDLLPMH
jgi:hypothetical protein